MKGNREFLWLNLICLVTWMIGFGIFPVLFFFSSDKKDYIGLAMSLLYVFIAYFVFMFAVTLFEKLKEKIRKSDEIQSISLNFKSILNTKIVSRNIPNIVVLFIVSYLAIGFWGTTDINKPFNRFEYEAIYEANLSKNSKLKNIERIEVWVKVSRDLFFKKSIALYYIPYKDKDIEFDEEPLLTPGKFIPVEFYFDGKDYKWYIEMSNVKLPDYIYTNQK